MNKRLKKSIILSLIVGGVISGIQVNEASALESSNIKNENISNIVKMSEEHTDEFAQRILNNSNYKTNRTVTVDMFNEDIVMVIETIEYKDNNEKAISNGTNFGTYSSIKMYEYELGRYCGTVGVDVQGKKISSTSAKINYIKYSNSGFASISKGAYKTFGVGGTGNPATGGVNVEFKYYAPDGVYKSAERIIPVKVYPSGNIKIN